MSDLATETQAYVDMLDEAQKTIETVHGQISATIDQWDGLLGTAMTPLPEPGSIDSDIALLDQAVSELEKMLDNTLGVAIEACVDEIGNLESALSGLQATWTAVAASLQSQLSTLAAQVAQHEADLTSAVTLGLVAALQDARQKFDQAAAPFISHGQLWTQELQGTLTQDFTEAWQSLTEALQGTHSANAQQFIQAAGSDATQAVQVLLDSAVGWLGSLGSQVEQSLEMLSGHLGNHVSQALGEMVEAVISTGVTALSDSILEALGVVTIGQYITEALAGSGVLEVLIPLNLVIEAILRAIQIFKDPMSVLGF